MQVCFLVCVFVSLSFCVCVCLCIFMQVCFLVCVFVSLSFCVCVCVCVCVVRYISGLTVCYILSCMNTLGIPGQLIMQMVAAYFLLLSSPLLSSPLACLVYLLRVSLSHENSHTHTQTHTHSLSAQS